MKKLLGEFLKWTLPVIFKCYDQTIPTGKEGIVVGNKVLHNGIREREEREP